jgi:DNA recombination protein RmuC
MEILFFAIILIIVTGGFVAIYQAIKKQSEKKSDDQSLLLIQNQIQDQQKNLQNQMNELNRTLDMKLGESSKAIRDQFGESAKIIKEITQELMKVGEGQKQMANVASDLKNLQDILKNPKQRGVLGEYYLETVLKNVLPPGVYKMQYEFKNGTIVDAVVITKDGIIPIDSKFSLENYNRFIEATDKTEREKYENALYADLKTRIDETAKYVKPEEGTVDFAFMFIPSEAIYYDLLINKIGAIKSTNVDLIEYAAGKKKVIVVSPTTFLAYLQTVMQGLKALHIEEAAKKIGERVEELGKHLKNYETFMNKIGKNLSATVSAYNDGGKEFKKIDKDIYKITGQKLDVDVPLIERPDQDIDKEEIPQQSNPE